MIELLPTSPTVLNRLAKYGRSTRVALQADLGVSGPTVTRAATELAEHGVIAGNASAGSSRGRPPETIALAADGLCSIGISVQADATTVRLLDARGQRAREIGLPLTKDSPYPDAVAAMGEAVVALAGEARLRFSALAGVGISFSGAADYASGAIAEASAFPAWRHKPLARDVEGATGLPTAIENYTVALAGAVNWFDPSEPRDFFLVLADYGVGGIASVGGGCLLGSARRPAGFGHVGGVPRGERPCHCGAFDCLTATASVRAIRERAREAGLACDGGDVGAMIAALDRDDGPAAALLEAAGARIARAALDLCRGMGFPACLLGGALFDSSARARRAAARVFATPGPDCTARFLGEVFADRSTDDLAAAAVAYHHLSRTRRLHALGKRRTLDPAPASRAGRAAASR